MASATPSCKTEKMRFFCRFALTGVKKVTPRAFESLFFRPFSCPPSPPFRFGPYEAMDRRQRRYLLSDLV